MAESTSAGGQHSQTVSTRACQDIHTIGMRALDKGHVEHMMQTLLFPAECTCLAGNADLNTCPEIHGKELNEHPVANERPFIHFSLDRNTNPSYESSFLASVAMNYFSRNEDEMDDDQLEALHGVRTSGKLEAVMNAFEADDANQGLLVEDIEQILKSFSHIFFFDSIADLYFEWTTHFQEPDLERPVSRTRVADARLMWCKVDGIVTNTARIRMHPTRTIHSSDYMRQIGLRKSQARIGALLHELIHCYIEEHACKHCEVWKRYHGGDHGRAFQLLAKAIEERSLGLLGINVDLGRLHSIMNDIKRNSWPPCGPSVHDMQTYGFLTIPHQRRPSEGYCRRLREKLKQDASMGTSASSSTLPHQAELTDPSPVEHTVGANLFNSMIDAHNV